MARLAVAPPPYPDESLAGYIIRLSERNAYTSHTWMLGLLRERSGCHVASAAEATRNPQVIAAVEAMAGLPERSLADRSFVSWSHIQSWPCGEPDWDARPEKAFQRDHPMICPACLEEAPYARRLWDLAHLPVCTRHGIALVDSCPDCGKPISWRRTAVSRCNACGADLRRAPQASVAPAVVELASLGLSPIRLGTAGHTELIIPEDMFRLLHLLVPRWPGLSLEASGKENFIKLPLGDRLQALTTLARCWNGSFLESAGIRQALLEHWRHLQAFNASFYLRKELRRWVDSADLQDSVAGMILHDYPDADADKAYHLYSGNPPRFANPEEIARYLGVEQPLLNCLRWLFLLKYPTPRYLAYDADDVLECRDFLDDLMTPEEVDEIVGAPGISRLLEQNRLIEPWCRQARKVCYAPDSLASLFDAIQRNLVPGQRSQATVRLRDLAQRGAEQLMRLIVRVLDGSLPVVGWDEPYRVVDVWVGNGGDEVSDRSDGTPQVSVAR